MKRAVVRLPAVALFILLVAYTVASIDRLRASRILWRVEATTIGMVSSNQTSKSGLAANIRLLRTAATLDPLEVGIPTALGGQYLLLDRPTAALAAYRSALAVEQRPEIFLNLGRAHLLAKDEPAAVESFRRAVQLAPSLIDEVPSRLRVEVLDRSQSDIGTSPVGGG